MNHPALVSICIPTFNGAKFLNQTFESIFNQTYKNLEIVISDDNSVDDTLNIANVFKQKTLVPVFIHKHVPGSIGDNWNNCIKRSSGKYIKLLFQDDIMEPLCIEKMVHAIEDSGKKICVCKRDFIIDQTDLKSKSIKRWLNIYSDLQNGISLVNDGKYTYITKTIFSDKCFLVKPYNKIGEPIVGLIEKSVFEEIGWYNKSLKQFLDYEFWYRALLKYDFVFLESKLVKFRIHFSQTSKVNYRNKVKEFPIYLDFVEKNLLEILHPETKKKWFGSFNVFIRNILFKQK